MSERARELDGPIHWLLRQPSRRLCLILIAAIPILYIGSFVLLAWLFHYGYIGPANDWPAPLFQLFRIYMVPFDFFRRHGSELIRDAVDCYRRYLSLIAMVVVVVVNAGTANRLRSMTSRSR